MIYYVNSEWSPLQANPFSIDGQYGESWSACIYDEQIEHYSNTIKNAKVYCIKISAELDKDFQRIMDFIQYETYYERNVIIRVNEKIGHEVQSVLSNNIIKNSSIIRDTDSRWLVHSTTKESWKEIQRLGCLYAPSELKRRNIIVNEIGIKVFMEPKDYSDYIMLDILNGCGEIVVNSRQLGYVCTDPNVPYNPGVRLYFDGHKIIKDGLAVRDGLHILKVKNELRLSKYLSMAITEEMILPKEIWTPTTYTEWANEYFLNNVEL